MITLLQTFKESVENRIRVSCAGLARIKIEDKYLFILNKNSVKIGQPNYGPLGGALEFTEAARPFLESLGTIFEKGMDLRFNIPASNLDICLKWFFKREDREVSCAREIYEELVLEEKILQMQESDVTESYAVTYTDDKVSNREGQQGVKTKGVYEIYDVTLKDTIIKDILNHINTVTDQKLILLTKEEILTDARLGAHCKYII